MGYGEASIKFVIKLKISSLITENKLDYDLKLCKESTKTRGM